MSSVLLLLAFYAVSWLVPGIYCTPIDVASTSNPPTIRIALIPEALNSTRQVISSLSFSPTATPSSKSSTKVGVPSNLPKSSVSVMEFLAYTPENLRASEYADWYANWTLKRQNDPLWREIGEWKLFAMDYFNTRNLECGSFWTDCKDMPSRSEIIALYPDDKVLARRVYFTGQSYLMIRNYLKAVQNILEEVNTSLYGMIPEIIKVFTNQPKPSALAACFIVNGLVDTLINVGVAAATGMVTAPVTSLYDNVKASLITATKDPATASRWYKNVVRSEWIPEPIIRWVRSQDQFNAWGEITPPVSESFGEPRKSGYPPHEKPELVPNLQALKDLYSKTYKNVPMVKPLTQIPANLRMGLRLYLQNVVRERIRLRLESSSLDGHGMCSYFGGGDKDKNSGNINNLQGQVSAIFLHVLDSLSDVYAEIYNGSRFEEGQYSWMARSMLNHDWAEERSYLHRLRHGSDMKQQILREFTFKIASQVSAKDGSYMKCSHKPWAAEKCDRMARAKSSDKAALAYFCPRPETDPGLVCQVGRWAFSSVFSHETPWPALLKLEGFLENKFNLTRLGVLNAVYDNYELNGNNHQFEWNSWFLGSLSSLASFRMPVCKNDDLAIHDNTVHGPGHKFFGSNSKAVPNVCGVNGNETEAFLDEIDALEGSPAWNSRSVYELWPGGGTNEFYNDRLVRVSRPISVSQVVETNAGQANRDSFGVNPFVRYRIMCFQHIRFAQHSDWKKPDHYNLLNHLRMHKGRDQECDLVLNATSNMSVDEGNRWFCQKHYEYGMDYGHTVFAREAWKVEIPSIPRDWVENHEHDCHKWLSRNGKTPLPVVPPIPGLPRPKTGLKWLHAMDAKKLRDKDRAAEAEKKKLDAEAECAFRERLKSLNKADAKAALTRHKQEQKEAKKLRKKLKSFVKAQNPDITDEKWRDVLRFAPQDEYKWKGWKGFIGSLAHPRKFLSRLKHGHGLKSGKKLPNS